MSIANHMFATNLLAQLRAIPGAVDLRVHQLFDQPSIEIDVNRTKAIESGFTQLNVASNLLVSLSGSFQTTPSFWLDPKTGVTYSVVAQTPQYAAASLSDLEHTIPIVQGRATEILGDVGSPHRGAGMAVVSHYNIQRAVDIFGSVQDRDLGGVAADINRIVDANRQKLPRGAQLSVRGQIETMRTSFQGLCRACCFPSCWFIY